MKTRQALAALALACAALGSAPAAFAQTPTTGAIPVPAKPATKKTTGTTTIKPVAPAKTGATSAAKPAKAKASTSEKAEKSSGSSKRESKAESTPGLAAKGARAIVGEVVDPACWIVNGAKGASHKDCAVACAKAGQVLGIVENKTQKLYMVANDKPGEDPNKTLVDYVGQKVLVRGRVYARGGVTGIKIVSVEPAGAATAGVGATGE